MSSLAKMDIIPIELIKSILEDSYLDTGSPDRLTLCACARLCRAWSEPAQKLLFRHVVIRGTYRGSAHSSFLFATNPQTERGRVLGSCVRRLELHIGDKATLDLDDSDLVNILTRTPRLYELVLRIMAIHKFNDSIMDQLRTLADPGKLGSPINAQIAYERPHPVRIRALSIISCGIMSPIPFQLLSVWPTIEFLHLGVEIAAPPPRWRPQFKLYQLTLMRTPRPSILSWLLSSSMDSLRIISFRDPPGHDLDEILEQIGPKLRSLRLMNYSLRAKSVLKQCPKLEEFVVVQLSPFFKLDSLPESLEHLSCRNLPSEDQSLDIVIDAVQRLPKLKVVTCEARAKYEDRFEELKSLCTSKGSELFVDDTPFWIREDPVHVRRFPRRNAVENFALMND